jgi:predicted DNA-binding transcriptional regulator AlpA
MQLDDRDEDDKTGRKSRDPPERLAHTIPEFCQLHSISKAHFYNLLKKGKAPEVLCVGRKRLVTVESAARWRAAWTAKTTVAA